MVRPAKIAFSIALALMIWSCLPGEPTGPDMDLSRKMTMNSVIRRGNDHYVFLSKWYEDPQFGYGPSSNKYDWSIEGASVILRNGDSTYFAEEILADTVNDDISGWNAAYTSYYHFTTPNIIPGDKWSIQVSHPDHDAVTATTTILGAAKFTDDLPDTLTADMDSIIFRWDAVNNAMGYQPAIYFYGWDTNRWVYQSLNYRTIEEDHISLTHEASTNRYTAYDLDDLFGQISHLPSNIPSRWANYHQFTQFLFIFGITAMDEALFYTVAVAASQDDLSSFSAPLQQFSNVQNGGGIFGSSWKTYRKKVVIPVARVLEAMQ